MLHLTRQVPTNLLSFLLTMVLIVEARMFAWRLPMWWLLKMQEWTREFYLTPPPDVLKVRRAVTCPLSLCRQSPDPRTCTVPLWPTSREWALTPLTRNLIVLFALVLPLRQCRCMVALIPPMPRLFVLSVWNALYLTLEGPIAILTALLMVGDMKIDVKAARCPPPVPKGERCITWRMLPLSPRQLHVHLFLNLSA